MADLRIQEISSFIMFTIASAPFARCVHFTAFPEYYLIDRMIQLVN